MKISLLASLSIIGILLSGSSITLAQDFDKLDEFFDQNFAEDPLNEKKGLRLPSQKKAPDSQKLDMGNDGFLEDTPSNFGLFEPLQEEAGLDLTTEEVLPLGSGKGIPVIAVSMISDSSDVTHLFDNLRIYTDFLETLDLAAGAFFLTYLTDFPPDAPMEWVKVLARGGIITVEPNVAQEYNVLKSPSWIVRTEEGDIVLEGLYSINQFFNTKGEFLETELKKIVSRSKVK